MDASKAKEEDYIPFNSDNEGSEASGQTLDRDAPFIQISNQAAKHINQKNPRLKDRLSRIMASRIRAQYVCQAAIVFAQSFAYTDLSSAFGKCAFIIRNYSWCNRY